MTNLAGDPRAAGLVGPTTDGIDSIYVASSSAASTSFPVFVAPFRCRLVKASIVAWNAGVTADNANYWRVNLARYYGGGHHTIASKTTQLTGGEAVTQRVPWTYDSIAFDPAESTLDIGDVAEFALFTSGAPAAFPGAAYTIYYVRA